MGIKEHKFDGDGYKTLIKFESWRVAVLNDSPDQKKDSIKYLERHNQTDEVFVLLKGKGYIIQAGTGKKPLKRFKTQKMKEGVFYNVKKSTWHSTVMFKKSKMLIVENRDTGDKNSELYYISEQERSSIKIN